MVNTINSLYNLCRHSISFTNTEKPDNETAGIYNTLKTASF